MLHTRVAPATDAAVGTGWGRPSGIAMSCPCTRMSGTMLRSPGSRRSGPRTSAGNGVAQLRAILGDLREVTDPYR